MKCYRKEANTMMTNRIHNNNVLVFAVRFRLYW